MHVKDKIFPYPVLNHTKLYSNYGDMDFIFSYTEVDTPNEFILKDATFITESKFINDLYEEGKIKINLVIECSYTVYRKAFEISNRPTDIHLSKGDFYEKVYFSMFAIATQDFIMKPEGVDEDYEDIEFEIEKYDILAANDGFYRTFRIEEKADNLAQSIFSIIINHDMEEGESYIVECDNSKKITIVMSEKDYKNYKIIYSVPTYMEVFFNMLLVPALIEGLSQCKNYVMTDPSADLEDVANKYLWFRTIIKNYKKVYGTDLTIEEFKSCSTVKIAQDLLGKPTGKALEKLVVETNLSEEEDGNE